MFQIESIVEWLFDSAKCPLCRLSKPFNEPLCLGCFADLAKNSTPCQVCAYPLNQPDESCPDCYGEWFHFDTAQSPLIYQFPMRELFQKIKQGKNPEPLFWMSQLLAKQIDLSRFGTQPTLIPIPSHPIDCALRGFNQAEIIAQHLSRYLKLPLDRQSLQKKRRTDHQASLNRAERKTNLGSTFYCNQPAPSHVLLIDDIHTTGTTFDRASEALKAAGTVYIEAISICRTPGR
ncbi:MULTISPECIES: ComF family protein [unclassified Marinobacterium]|jgi:ComF family protein|uniref:ComF family protein n=1 Tax=unclassified Marinobacterium TaxID=2644139 RepID=UPI00156A3E60|nr:MULTISPECIES: ComF family protein [unclassified Marinobacterium]NRP10142.1 DNA utilization protein GntX [Marinobacterium sp. xm-g-48]NRP27797.1 DNA utilization protein GntX [Marinobacterium sp. xm-d-420]NRP37032.1 DNA utilization protein GntX [Marinobacterium sp. xm-d-579]NRP38377.1 DNA utilization protein GntX [Marinobacterium sp. xm-a-121]NRP47155.1 DNA utilization protein GntX [Marinobacterium sp. xm-d-543]